MFKPILCQFVAHKKKYIAFYISSLGLFSALFGLLGIPGGWLWGISSLLMLTLVLILWVLFDTIQHTENIFISMTLDDAIRDAIFESSELKCIFSSAVRMKLFFDVFLEDNHDKLKHDFNVKTIVRSRKSNSNNIHVLEENLASLQCLFSKYNIGFEYRAIPWHYFMVRGIIFDENRAVVDFYYRSDNKTSVVSGNVILVDKRNNGFEKYLYQTLNCAFGAFWR